MSSIPATRPRPMGIGIHPRLRTTQAHFRAKVDGIWMTGDDPLPRSHTRNFPSTWDLCESVAAIGTLIDNAYTGWSGGASIEWPEQPMRLDINVVDMTEGYGHFYRPPHGATFCVEPASHPINAFHLP